MRGKKLKLPPEVAGRRLRCLRVIGIPLNLGKELFRCDTYLVDEASVAEVDAARHHVDVEALHIFVRDIGCRVGYDRELPASVVTRVSLAVHVVDLFGADRAVLSGHLEHMLRFIDMDVDLGLALGAGKYERIPECTEVLSQFASVDISPRDNALGAVAKLGFLVGAGGYIDDLVERMHDGTQRNLVVDEELHRSFEEGHKPLGAGIYDPGAFQYFELVGRVGEGLPEFLDRRRQDNVEALLLLIDGVLSDGARERSDDGQDRAFPRFGDGIVRVLAALFDGLAERVCRIPVHIAGGVGYALKELGDDRAGVAAGAVEERIR